MQGLIAIVGVVRGEEDISSLRILRIDVRDFRHQEMRLMILCFCLVEW